MRVVRDIVETYSVDDKFEYSQALCTDGKNFFKVTSPRYSVDFVLDDIDRLPRVLIPPDHAYPRFDATKHSRVSNEKLSTCFIKGPSMISYDPSEKDLLPNLVLDEIKVCEILKLAPHPNISKYLGCKVENNLVVGLCFEKLRETLQERLKRKDVNIDVETCTSAITSATEHLHSLGFCHNDLSPFNIMYRPEGTLALIDFDSCKRIGDKLGWKRGTPGFFDESATCSETKNDFYSIEKVRQYIVDLRKQTEWCDVTRYTRVRPQGWNGMGTRTGKSNLVWARYPHGRLADTVAVFCKEVDDEEVNEVEESHLMHSDPTTSAHRLVQFTSAYRHSPIPSATNISMLLQYSPVCVHDNRERTGIRNWAPIQARRVFSAHSSAQPCVSSTASTPAAAADLTSNPRLPGSRTVCRKDR